ncbi:MAG: TRAP transporter permease [Desulfovibrionaceae bacterium]|jgi:TRAP transporter 4TM/12TM fusion protein|nr:TRAP transporter permease [Desulfovibrionaceae bacterium]
MPPNVDEQNLTGVEYAQQLAETESGLGWAGKGFRRNLTIVIAVTWSIFQLCIASWLLLDSIYIRAIHLAFGLILIYLNIPFIKYHPKRRPDLKYLLLFGRITFLDILLGVASVGAALYIVLDYDGIAMRYGMPIERDIILGVVLVVTLLEATRRIIGPALPVIALGFIAYAFAGPYMPDVIAFKGVSLDRFVGQMSMSSEGIYGIPLDVSATIVFLFVLFGTMLEKAGAGNYFIKLALSLLGGFKGGPAKAAILGSGLTGMVSGSSIANIVTTGTFTIPLMKKVGYPATKAAAIEVAASTDGQLAPPIMGAAAFIIAEYVNVPYVDVIKAAAVPAFVSYASLLYISHVEASKLGLRGMRRSELPPLFKTLFSGVHYLIPLCMLLYELVVLRHSPELAAFNAIVVLAAVMLVQKPVMAMRANRPVGPAILEALGDVFISLADGARNMAGVAMATAAAGIIVGVVALGLGGLITQIIDVLSAGNIYLMLVITAVASLIIGMGLPTTATYIVMASLTAPAIVHIGGDYGFIVPLMAAHLFCFFFGILADDTPPVGLAAYAAAAIAESPPIPTGIQGFLYDIRTAILPFMFIFNHDLILHDIDSFPMAIMIFVTACIGNFAFASATQGWLRTNNRWYEIPFMLCITLVMLRPDATADLLGVPHEQRYWCCLIGIALFGLLYLAQGPRARANNPKRVAAW